MGARVLVVGLDAASTPRLDRLLAEGRLPHLAALAARGVRAPLRTCLDTLPGSVWPELATGISAGRLGLYYHPWQIHSGEAYGRPVAAEDVDAGRYWWNVAARAGLRVAVIDATQAAPDDTSPTVQVFEWGLHDRNFAIQSRPPGLIDELRATHGDHPIGSCDAHDGTVDGYRRLRADLLEGARRKADLALDVLGREDWDLFVCGFGESHCVGHQFWHFADPRHPDHEPDAPAELRRAVDDVYAALDEGVGRLVAAAPDATVVVVASHGMDVPTGGYQLMPHVVARLGLGTGQPRHASIRRFVPAPVRRALRAVVPERVQQDHKLRAREFEAEGTLALAVKNNRCGAIRLNLVGREPHGLVTPGPEAEALVAEIRRELGALRLPGTDESIVAAVRTADEAFGPDHHPDLPDLLVEFRDDLGIIEACESPRVGVVRAPVRTRELPRTGDHQPPSAVWAAGTGVTGRGAAAGGTSLDVGPSVLHLLGVPVPGWVDGVPLPWLSPVSAGPG